MRRAWVFAAVVLITTMPAHAYEFWLRAQTIGQAYQLRDYRLLGPDLMLGRRRVTQTLALRIWDVGDLALARRRAHRPEHGLRVSLQVYLRIDHDFGDYTNSRTIVPGPRVRDVLDVIPELGDSVAALDLMYAYVQLEGLADDRLAVQLGRILADDGWGTTAFDGAAARFELPAPVAVSASAGLHVRASSPFGVSAYELDGTSGVGCQEYVEGPTPGSGSWQLIDRNRQITNHALSSDYAYCPQRDVAQPTIGLSVATSRTRGWGAELGYRRTWSDTVGLIGPVDRLAYPDLGLYPNDFGQAPATGVDEERLYARVHGTVAAAGLELSPYVEARYSLLHATFDRADAGVRIRRGEHVVEPMVSYFYPTFDGDSIFNAFSIDPTTDGSLTYSYAPGGAWRASANAWLRHYAHVDGEASYAGGLDAGLEHALGGSWRGRVDGLWDDGWGGRRIGGSAEAAWHDARTTWLRGRAIVLGVRDDATAFPQSSVEVPANVGPRAFVTSSMVASATWRVAETVAVHAIAEADHDPFHALQTRAIVVLDLAFAPEP
jgi:hypothetical protein